MEKIIFVRSADCRVCALEIRDAPRKKLERIIEERKHTTKCRGCERLEQVIEEMSKYGNTR